MNQFQITIRSFEKVREFISIATVQPFRVLVGNGAQLVNAKSFIGMVSLDFSRPLTVTCECDANSFHSFRQQVSAFLAS